MSKTCVILQPSYIPWRGYFDLVHRADIFVFYDDVQYEKGSWRNRNRIKTAQGPVWLTVPVESGQVVSDHRPISQVRISGDRDWRRKHLETFRQAYRKAPFFELAERVFCEILKPEDDLLCPLTVRSVEQLSKFLGIERTEFVLSSSLNANGSKTARLVEILKKVEAGHYLSGPAAKAYLDEDLLKREGIELEYMNYDYPEYEQLHPPYEPQVSVLDLLAMKGADAGHWIWKI